MRLGKHASRPLRRLFLTRHRPPCPEDSRVPLTRTSSPLAGRVRDSGNGRYADGQSRGSPPPNSQRQKHCKYIVSTLRNSAQEHAKAFKDTLLQRAAVSGRKERRARLGRGMPGTGRCVDPGRCVLVAPTSRTYLGSRSSAQHACLLFHGLCGLVARYPGLPPICADIACFAR